MTLFVAQCALSLKGDIRADGDDGDKEAQVPIVALKLLCTVVHCCEPVVHCRSHVVIAVVLWLRRRLWRLHHAVLFDPDR